jgi:hypothetical protein
VKHTQSSSGERDLQRAGEEIHLNGLVCDKSAVWRWGLYSVVLCGDVIPARAEYAIFSSGSFRERFQSIFIFVFEEEESRTQ